MSIPAVVEDDTFRQILANNIFHASLDQNNMFVLNIIIHDTKSTKTEKCNPWKKRLILEIRVYYLYMYICTFTCFEFSRIEVPGSARMSCRLVQKKYVSQLTYHDDINWVGICYDDKVNGCPCAVLQDRFKHLSK